MAQYTIEDIEILRQKGGVSYEEAVNLLEYHNGSLARALVDMEKNGKIKPDTATTSSRSHQFTAQFSGTAGRGGKNIFTFLYRTRLKVNKGSVPVVNLSLLFCLIVLFFAPWILVVGGIMSLVLGYRFGIERNSKDFGESFDSVIKNAAGNAKSTVYTMASEITGKNGAEQPKPEAEPSRAQNAPTGTTPVNVQFPGEGNVEVKSDAQGYHEADIQ